MIHTRLSVWLRLVLIVPLTLALGTAARAQQGPSAGPIRLVVGAAAGGSISVYARIVADHMANTLGQTLIVENKPGANGNIAAQFVADASADGSAIWVGTQSMIEINPSAYKSLRWKPADFIPVIKGIESPLMLSTHPSVPAKTLAELIAWVKTNPKKLSYASYSAGTPSHFLGFQMNERFGLDMAHVPYRGGAPQVTDLLAGHALIGFTQVQGALEHVRAGRLNAILTTGAQRARAVPDLPTFAELGYPELTAAIWFGLLLKTGTAADVVGRIEAAGKAAHADAGVRARLEEQGFEVSGLTGPAFKAGIDAQFERWARIVKATGFSAD
jgi:tripartite-type tricarboxylate transporter receptor subunit TctC